MISWKAIIKMMCFTAAGFVPLFIFVIVVADICGSSSTLSQRKRAVDVNKIDESRQRLSRPVCADCNHQLFPQIAFPLLLLAVIRDCTTWQYFHLIYARALLQLG